MTAQDSKKRKRSVVVHQHDTQRATSKPSAVFQPTEGRQWTVSIALPGSIIANALTHDVKSRIAGQVARAAAVFCVDEVVIFNDGQNYKNRGDQRSFDARPSLREHHTKSHTQEDGHSIGNNDDSSYTGFSDPDHFLFHLLSYLEAPPHLRKHLFPLHPNLRAAGQLPSLDMPHHPRVGEWCRYREGVTIPTPNTDGSRDDGAPAKKPKKEKTKSKHSHSADSPDPSTFVEIGLSQPVQLPGLSIPPATRVTLLFDSEPSSRTSRSTPATATAVAPTAPREEAGYYWGYTARQAGSLAAVFTECPFDGGYDVSVGMSERGVPLSSVVPATGGTGGGDSPGKDDGQGNSSRLPPFSHLLLVFGGLAGLEAAVEADRELSSHGVHQASEVFDFWINTCPGQGSRTIRTEEAVWLGLMGTREYVLACGR